VFCKWEFMFPTLAAKEKGVAKHGERWHGDVSVDTDEVCEQMVVNHSDEAQLVVEAIVAVARVNHGKVDPNAVRELLPTLEHPQVIGSVYRVMRNDGRLKPVEQGVNNDTKSGNAGKPQPIYEYVGHGQAGVA
jgi:hypothetical protein